MLDYPFRDDYECLGTPTNMISCKNKAINVKPWLPVLIMALFLCCGRGVSCVMETRL